MGVVVQMDRAKEVLLLDSCMVIFNVFLKISIIISGSGSGRGSVSVCCVTRCGVCFDP